MMKNTLLAAVALFGLTTATQAEDISAFRDMYGELQVSVYRDGPVLITLKTIKPVCEGIVTSPASLTQVIRMESVQSPALMGLMDGVRITGIRRGRTTETIPLGSADAAGACPLLEKGKPFQDYVTFVGERNPTRNSGQ